MKILVTGAKGQLGSEINYLSHSCPYEFEFIDREELDLTDKGSIIPFLENSNPDYIINCAAYTAVDQAEDEPELADVINSIGPKRIAEYCNKNNKRLIHISTDYVFDGIFNTPINEEDLPNPRSVYGQTKLDGEKAVQELLDDVYIIRTSWVYSEFGNNFVKTMIRLGSEREEISVVADQYGTPTWARDLADAILQIINQITNGNDQPSIYHFSNEGKISWNDFAKEIMAQAKLTCKVNPISTYDYPTKAERPKYSVLNKSKIVSNFKVSIPLWEDSLNKYFLKIQ